MYIMFIHNIHPGPKRRWLTHVEVGRLVLTRLHRSEVMVKEWGAPIGNQYYRSLMPDFPISLCGSCNKVSYSSPSIPILSHMHTHTYMHA